MSEKHRLPYVQVTFDLNNPKQKELYEDISNYDRQKFRSMGKYHNIVFLGKDSNGNTRFASMRGTGSNFKCDVIGNDKNYGFNLSDNKSNEVQVFEAAIDLMSYCDLYNEFKGNKLAMGMVCDHPLERFLEEHPQITKIVFSLDMDNIGIKAAQELKEKYQLLGYEVSEKLPSAGKDYNDYLQLYKTGKAVLQEPLTSVEMDSDAKPNRDTIQDSIKQDTIKQGTIKEETSQDKKGAFLGTYTKDEVLTLVSRHVCDLVEESKGI